MKVFENDAGRPNLKGSRARHRLVWAASIFCACGGAQNQRTPERKVTRSIDVEGTIVKGDLVAQDAEDVDALLREPRDGVTSDIGRCLDWRARLQHPLGVGIHAVSPAVEEFMRRVADAVCGKAQASLPTTIKGEGFAITFEMGKGDSCYGNPNALLASDSDYASAIVVRGPVGFSVDIQGRATSRWGPISDGSGDICHEPKGQVRFGVIGGDKYTVTIIDGRSRNVRGQEIFKQEFALPRDVKATIALDLVVAPEPTIEDVLSTPPNASKMPTELQACPADWTTTKKGLCYKLESLEVEGIIPVISLWLWSPQNYAVVTATIGIVEDGKTKCTDGFGLRKLEAKKVRRLVYKCPINEPLDNLSDSRVVMLVQDAQ